MILLGSGTGVLIEAWKVRVFRVVLTAEFISPMTFRSQKPWTSVSSSRLLVLDSLTNSTLRVRLSGAVTVAFSSFYHADKHVLSEDEKKTQEYLIACLLGIRRLLVTIADTTSWLSATYLTLRYLPLPLTQGTPLCTTLTGAGIVSSSRLSRRLYTCSVL